MPSTYHCTECGHEVPHGLCAAHPTATIRPGPLKATLTQWPVIDHEPDPELFALAMCAPLSDRLAAGDVLLLHGSEGWCLSNDPTDMDHDDLERRLEHIRRDLGIDEHDEFRILIRCG